MTDLAAAYTAAGLAVRYASSPEGGPGIVIDIPDLSWDSFPSRSGCGSLTSADMSVNVWIVAHGHSDDQRLVMEDKTWAALQATPPPWRIVAVNHDRSTPDQYVREIQLEL